MNVLNCRYISRYGGLDDRTYHCLLVPSEILRLESKIILNDKFWNKIRCIQSFYISATTQSADPSNRQNNLDPHVLSLMHNLSINKHLVSSKSIAHSIRWICDSGNLDLAPFTVRWDQLALRCESTELLVDALLLNTSFPLDKRGV